MNLQNINFSAMLQNMVIGSGQVLQIFFLTALFAVPLGFILALGRSCKYKIISIPIRIYQLIVRGTPLMLQLMFIMYGPYYIFGLSYDRFVACIIAFVLNYSAYFGEIFRGGIESIPQGQYEAGKVLGYTKIQTFMHIVLPQVVKRVIPATGNEFMTLIKDTALAQTISVPQLFEIAKTTASASVSVVPFIVAAIFYLVMNGVVEGVFKKIENKLNYYK